MEELIKLATKQLLQFKEIAPELMAKLIEYYSFRLDIYHNIAILLMAISGAALLGGIIWNIIGHLNNKDAYFHFDSLDGPIYIYVFAGIGLFVSIGLYIDFCVARKLMDLAPEVYVLRKLL